MQKKKISIYKKQQRRNESERGTGRTVKLNKLYKMSKARKHITQLFIRCFRLHRRCRFDTIITSNARKHHTHSHIYSHRYRWRILAFVQTLHSKNQHDVNI